MSRAASRLREEVYRANLELAGSGLVSGTFGNVSGVDRAAGLFVIKPSGVPYAKLTPAQLVAVSLETGEVIGRGLRPSSDTPTHLELYRAFPAAAASCTRTRSSRRRSRRPASRSAAWARRTPTTSAATCRSRAPLTAARGGRRLRAEHRPRDRRDVPEAAACRPTRSPPCWCGSTGRSPGARTPLAAVENARVLEFVARLEILVRATGARRHSRPRASSSTSTSCASTARARTTGRS